MKYNESSLLSSMKYWLFICINIDYLVIYFLQTKYVFLSIKIN